MATDTLPTSKMRCTKAETSVVLWGAYNNPRSLPEAILPPSADGPARVREYHEGLRATHQGPPSHNTTIGHSYAGVLAGHTATHGPSPAAPSFGATVFGTDSTPSESRLGWNPDDHLATNYFGSNNRSYTNIGLIVAGHGDLVSWNIDTVHDRGRRYDEDG